MEGVGVMAETAWSLVPPVITIVLALVTKEVYMSLAIGIFIGAFMFTGFNFLGRSTPCLISCRIRLRECEYSRIPGSLGIIVSAIQKSGASGVW